MADYTAIVTEQAGHVLKITLNRPEKRNAQNGDLIAELHDAMVRADQDDSVHVVTLFGAGPAFSAGHDLKDGSGSGPFAHYDRESLNGKLQYADDVLFGYWMFIHDLRKPTIAAVHGFVATAGISLAAMCDLIVAADDAKFLDHAVTLFSTPGTELGWYPWELGVRKAKEFLWTQPVWDAATMERLGLVNRVVPRAELESTVMAMAEQIALASPLAVQLTKKSINEAWKLMGKRAAFDYHLVVQQSAMHSDESARKAEQRGGKDTREWLAGVRQNARVTDPHALAANE
ncbi:MAG: enoyl-CoA hydratase/isomerase family protein [Dehalococcoidia bacterium]|nr:enoyl-CoA hydratase/isomerase family protein [Dehalococcoidia bacterium]